MLIEHQEPACQRHRIAAGVRRAQQLLGVRTGSRALHARAVGVGAFEGAASQPHLAFAVAKVPCQAASALCIGIVSCSLLSYALGSSTERRLLLHSLPPPNMRYSSGRCEVSTRMILTPL